MKTSIPFGLSLTLALVALGAAPARAALQRRPIEKPARTVLAEHHEPALVAVKFQDGLSIRLRAGELSDLGTGALTDARSVIEGVASGRWERTHHVSETDLDSWRARGEANAGGALPDLNLEFRVRLAPGIDAERAIDALNALPIVELAWPVSRPAPPPAAPDYTGLQGYVAAAPGGIGAAATWRLPQGTAHAIRICDIEYEYNANHADLPAITLVGPPPLPAGFGTNHATAVLGQLFAEANGSGVTGASYGAEAYFAAAYTAGGWNVAAAITNALGALGAGDVLLIEQQMVGPLGGTAYVPVEWDLSVYNAIRVGVANHVTVVEAGANGNQNLDGAIYNAGHAPFLPANDSGAILVGAGCSPGGSSTDRSRLGFSNYGSTLDLQGWGENVCTTGYGTLYAAGGIDEYYTATFGGTSGASPIVASAAAILQANFHGATGGWLTPAQVRDTLRTTGSPQQSGTFPASQVIGPRPDLAAAWAALGLWSCAGEVDWSMTSATPGLAGRRDMAIAYDSARRRVLLFGGSDSNLVLQGDLWERAAGASTWSPVTFVGGPSPRSAVAMAYDRKRDRLVLFGGTTAGTHSGETWEFDGASWSLRSTTGPAPRAYHAMAYDELRQRVVVLGGSCFGVPGGTWEWDGTSWVQLASSPYSTTSTTMRPRLAWDSERQVMVAFGGGVSGSDSGETWERSGTTWSLRATSGPSPRTGVALVHDRVRQRTVLYGGAQTIPFVKFDDTWEWDGTSWQPVTVLASPGARTYHGAAYDEGSGRMLVFGGDSPVQIALADTWTRGHAPAPGVPFCLGDNGGTPCPCANPSAGGTCRGCRNSTGEGARLASSGVASLTQDTVLLLGSGMPNSSALYFQGTIQQAGGAGTLLGDGLLCAGGFQVRMGALANSGGASSFPPPATAPISVRGGITTPGTTRTYQIWYRDTTPFCTSEPYNASNGLRIVWGP